MLYLIATFVMPPLLVFGLYHLLTWFNLFGVNEQVYWKRVAIAAVLSHLLLVTGFFIFSYFDFSTNRQFAGTGLNFGSYLFDRSRFWNLMTIFDTVPMLVLLALFSLMDTLSVNVPGLVIITAVVIYLVGSVQWYLVGGGIGAILERFWSGLKTGDDEDEDWM